MTTSRAKTGTGYEGPFKAPDLRLRDSSCFYGSLQITVNAHRVGAELGRFAGENAYQQWTQTYGRGAGLPDLATLNSIMNGYLEMPAYRPLAFTSKIISEWRAMFVMAWTDKMLSALAQALSLYEGTPR